MWIVDKRSLRRLLFSTKGVLGLILTGAILYWTGEMAAGGSSTRSGWGVAIILVVGDVMYWISTLADQRIDRMRSEEKLAHPNAIKGSSGQVTGGRR
jgi:hypothetical protein